MKTPVPAASSKIPAQPFLTLFNLLQVIEIPLSPGFSRELLEIVSTCFQSTFPQPAETDLRPVLHSAFCTLHSRNPYCTAVFRTVPRNRIFSHLSQIELISNSRASLAFAFWALGHFPSPPLSLLPSVKRPTFLQSLHARMLTFPSQLPDFFVEKQNQPARFVTSSHPRYPRNPRSIPSLRSSKKPGVVPHDRPAHAFGLPF
jgi:hypothetical protein